MSFFKKLLDLKILPKLLAKSLRYTAFTLAEVIIVLGIIGIVAEMTIPTLISNVETEKYRGSFKKTYSMLAQACISFKQDGETSIEKLYNYLKTSSICSGSSCWDSRTILCADGTAGINNVLVPGTIGSSAILNDGAVMATLDLTGRASFKVSCGGTFYTYPMTISTLGTIDAVFLIDVNGYASPNRVGKDIYILTLKGNTIATVGSGCDTSGAGCSYEALMN